MKKALKITALILSLVMLAGIFCGCGGEKKVNTGSKFTYWASMSSAASQTVKSYGELLMYQEMSKATGTEVEFIHPAAGSTGTEAFQILLSSGDYPDMIEYNWKGYAGGPDRAIEDGVIISLNEYLEDYAPNYYDYLEGEKARENGYLYKAQSISGDGNYFGFANLNIGTYRGFGGLYIRKDKLDEWGLEIPVTIDDWTNCLKTAKENGFKAPLTGVKTLFSITGADMFNLAWNVNKYLYVDNGKVKFGPFEKQYKEYVKQMAEWMKDGLVDPDYVTNASTNVEGYMTNGSSIASFGWVGSGIGKLLPAMAEKDPNYSVVACPYPVLKEGDTPWSQELQSEANSPYIAISTQCGMENEDRCKEAVKWCDYLYSDEGMVLKSFGIEGETYTIEKGEDGEEHYIYTDKITDHEKIGAHSVEAALYHFMRPANAPGLNQHPDYLNGFYPYEQQKDAIVVWNKNVDEARKHVLPPISYTGEEATQKANIEAAVRDNLDAAISNIILGKASIDTYDDAVKKAKKEGYSELIKIVQGAYNRYAEVIKENR
jgi:putative aldouronate transport system substrate-binding protein